MAEKLSWTELRHLLATRAGVSEKEANSFLNALQTQLIEGLKQDKQVKVNGLGTFRLQSVAPRKSVNVTTGEEMTIEGYNKIAFMPEAGVKELVEKLKVESGDLKTDLSQAPIDPIQKLGEQAEEIKDILGELGQSPEAEVEPEVVPEPIAEPEAVAEPEPESVAEPEPVVEPAPEPEPEPEPKPEVVAEPEPVAEPKKKEYHFVRDTLICVVCLLLVLLIGYFFFRGQIASWIENLGAKEEPVEVVEVVVEEVVLQPQTQVYEEFITTEKLTYGSRLAWLSKKYYGTIVYWPYIYDANRDKVEDPNYVLVGTAIRVPKLTEAQMDTTSEQTRINLEYLSNQK